MSTTTPTPEDLFREAFDCARTPRSEAYKAGVFAALLHRSEGRIGPLRGSPYAPGTAELDAWWAGTDEGRLIWSNRDWRDEP